MKFSQLFASDAPAKSAKLCFNEVTMRLSVALPTPKTHCGIKRVAIFGSADVDEEHPLYHDVFSLARHLAYQGITVVDGGGPGVMAAATLGAKSANGKTIAVTFKPENMPEFEGRFAGNTVDIEIKTANYVERMFGLMDQADAFICVQGGTGTLSEWATAWLMAHLQFGNHKPLVLYGAFWHKLLRVVSDSFFIGEKEHEVYSICETPEEVFVALTEFEHQLANRCGLPAPETQRPKD